MGCCSSKNHQVPAHSPTKKEIIPPSPGPSTPNKATNHSITSLPSPHLPDKDPNKLFRQPSKSPEPKPAAKSPELKPAAKSTKTYPEPTDLREKKEKAKPAVSSHAHESKHTDHQRHNSQDRPSTILVHFDFPNRRFHYYKALTNTWLENELDHAKNDCPKCPLFDSKHQDHEKEALKLARSMNCIAVSDELVYLIGGHNAEYSCLEYNVAQNKFDCKKPLATLRNNPSLCTHGTQIFAVSGDLLNAYSTRVTSFNVQTNNWTVLPSLPVVQGNSSVSVIGGKDPNSPLRLAVVGGLSEKFPKKYANVISLMNFSDKTWSVIELNQPAPRIPKFIRSPVVEDHDGNLIILGSKFTRAIQKFDMTTKKLSVVGYLPNDETFNDPSRSKEAFVLGDSVFCMAHRLNLKVYKGDLEAHRWSAF